MPGFSLPTTGIEEVFASLLRITLTTLLSVSTFATDFFSEAFRLEVDIFSVYMIYKNSFKNNSAFLSKIGYSVTNLKNDSGTIIDGYSIDNVGVPLNYSWKTKGNIVANILMNQYLLPEISGWFVTIICT